MSWCWWCTTSPPTAGRMAPLARDLSAAYAARSGGPGAGLGAAAGAVRRLHPVAARAPRRARTTRTACIAGQLALLASGAGRCAGGAGAAHRPAPAGRGLTPRAARCALRVDAEVHDGSWSWPASSGASLFMVVQAALAVLLHPAGRGYRHPDRHPGRRPHRRGAGRPGRVLRQHPGAAHRPVGDPTLRRAAGAGPGTGPGGVRAPGRAVRAAGGGAQPGAVDGPAPAVPGHARLPEQHPARTGPARPDSVPPEPRPATSRPSST